MNIELIKKYKAEFDHWLNGGEVIYNFKDNRKFYNLTWDESIDALNYIIVNDEYVEFRKALAEGKTIQWTSSDNQYDYPLWEIVTKIDTYFPVNRYRIKSEEPQFKVGDWIRSKDGIDVCAVTKDTIRFYKEGFNKDLSDEWELWQPQPGEWCWFRDNRGEASLRQFLQMCPVVKTNYISKQGLISGTVEPFIGKLPTFLKA